MFFTGVVILGLIAIWKIQIGYLPGISLPTIVVETRYPGVDPQKIETLITTNIEDALSTSGGIKSLFSTSKQGKSRIEIKFKSDTNLKKKSVELRDLIEPVALKFPLDVNKPEIYRFDPDKKPVIILDFKSDFYTLTQIRQILEKELKKKIQSINGVGEIIIAGGEQPEILINCDHQKLRTYDMGLEEVMSAIRSNNKNAGAGRVLIANEEYPIYFRGRIKNISDLSEIVIGSGRSGKKILLKDVADVESGFRDSDSASRLNGKDIVSLYIYQASGSNLIEMSKQVHRIMERFDFPEINISVNFDKSQSVLESFTTNTILSLIGVILVLFFIALIFRETSISRRLLLDILIAVCFTVFVLFVFELELDLLALAGIISGINILVIQRLFLAMFVQKKGVYLFLLLQILMVSSFLFISKSLLNLYLSFLVAHVAFNLISSVVVLSFTCKTPIVVPGFIDPGIGGYFDLFSNAVIKAIKAANLKWVAVLVISFSCLAIVLYSNIKKDSTIASGIRRISATLDFPSGTSFEATKKVSTEVEKKLLKSGVIDSLSSRLQSGQVQYFININQSSQRSDSIIEKLKSSAGKTSPGFLYFQLESETGNLRDITVDVLGHDLKTLDKLAKKISRAAESLNGAMEVVLRYKAPRPEHLFFIRKEKLSQTGLSHEQLGNSLRTAIQGGVASRLLLNQTEVDIRIRYNKRFRKDIENIKEYYIKSPKGFVPMYEYLVGKNNKIPSKIYHKNKKRVLSFSIRFKDISVSNILEQITRLKSIQLPDGYRIEVGEEFDEQNLLSSELAWLLFFALVIGYMAMASFFDSARKAILYVYSWLFPLAFILSIFFVFGMSVSIPLHVSLLSLLAIFSFIFYYFISADETIKSCVYQYSVLCKITFLILLLNLPFLVYYKAEAILEFSLVYTFGCLAFCLALPFVFYSIQSKMLSKTFSG